MSGRDTPVSARRLLLCHAHPDDESIGTGATMAKYAAEGHVTLLTSTQGEEGEVLIPGLRHIASDCEDRLGPYRAQELAKACEVLGVADHRFLGGSGRWRDSGMAGFAANGRVDSFCRADFDEAVQSMVHVIREVKPHVVVTYDPHGGYGHPDHIQTHRVTVVAFTASANSALYPEAGVAWKPSKLYFTAVGASTLAATMESSRSAAPIPFAVAGARGGHGIPYARPDDEITARLELPAYADAKRAALACHRTQIKLRGNHFALADGVGHHISHVEEYVLARGVPGDFEGGFEHDLFSGVAVDSVDQAHSNLHATVAVGR